MGVDVVLDTSALFAMEQPSSDDRLFTTPGVIGELEKYGDRRGRHLFQLVSISTPGREAVKRVERAARDTGDHIRLSRVDIELIALAVELEAVIMTDDYSIQNLASYLGLEYRSVGQKGITKVIRWKLRCTGCGRVFSEPHSECPICGSELRSYSRIPRG